MSIEGKVSVIYLLPVLAMLTTPATGAGRQLEMRPSYWYCFSHDQGTTCIASQSQCTLGEAAYYCANDPELMQYGMAKAAYCDAGYVQCEYD